jgi:hypothetical protein
MVFFGWGRGPEKSIGCRKYHLSDYRLLYLHHEGDLRVNTSSKAFAACTIQINQGPYLVYCRVDRLVTEPLNEVLFQLIAIGIYVLHAISIYGSSPV